MGSDVKHSKTFTVTARLGLHLRAATMLAKTARRFDSTVAIRYKGLEVDAKSLMGLLLLGASTGSEVTVVAQGDDAEQAISGLAQLFESGFGEQTAEESPAMLRLATAQGNR